MASASGAARAGAVPPTAAEAALERLAGELLRERRSERRWRVGVRLGWLMLACVLVGLW